MTAIRRINYNGADLGLQKKMLPIATLSEYIHDGPRKVGPSDTRQFAGFFGACLSVKPKAREVMRACFAYQNSRHCRALTPWPVTPKGSSMRGTLSTQIRGPRKVTGKRAKYFLMDAKIAERAMQP